MGHPAKKAAFYVVLIAVLVFIESSIPYFFAERNTPAGYQFLGQVTYAPDQNMYFSFISQARDGAFVLKNKLTAIPHKPVFINLEFWLVGFIQRITGVTENVVYQIWRFIGVLLLALGFYMTAHAILPDRHRKWAAFVIFLCTGGFGFIFAGLSGLHLIGFDATQAGIIDMRYGILPFQQIITNPHFSMPHGLILIAYAFFVWGELYGKTRYYIFSGLMFCVIGLVRPYDLIPPVIIFPLYLLANGSLRFNMKDMLRRLCPLLMIVPVLLYDVWLFKVHDVFKYWSQQGLNAGTFPSVPWHYAAYGIVGVMAIVRLLQLKKRPAGKMGIFVMLWFGVTFAFIQLGKVFPAIGWSPQIGVYLAAPLTLAACSIRLDEIVKPVLAKYVVIPVVVLFIVVSNLSLVSYHSRKFMGNVDTNVFYATNEEMEALAWLRGHSKVGEVVLANPSVSQHIAKYTHNSVIAAHYSVTPRFAENALLVQSTLDDTAILAGIKPLQQEMRADYLYLSAKEKKQLVTGKYLSEVFTNRTFSIYKITQGN